MLHNIGIIGVSPYGAALCHMKIITALAELSIENNRCPEIIAHSYPFKRYLELGPGPNNNWSEVHSLICHSIRKVKQSGADFVIIPANTVHYQFDSLQKLSALPIINIVEKTVDFCVSKKIQNVTLIGTSYTVFEGLYEPFLNMMGINVCYLSEKDNQFFDNLITSDLMQGKLVEYQTLKALKIIEKTKTDAVLLACTELSVLCEYLGDDMNVIDSLQILVDAAIDTSVKGMK